MHEVRIGCSGWSYRSWVGGLYPEGLGSSHWLERYAEVFDTVEVNATFYRLPEKKTVRAWAEQVPDDFVFAIKASRYLTHMRRLRGMKKGLGRFWARLEPLRSSGKLGPVLWQLPERFQRDDETLAAALAILPEEARAPSSICGSTTALGDEAATTPSASWTLGAGGSPPGAPGGTSSPTSTTIGRASPPATPPSCATDCLSRAPRA